jgi:hypothetical protein
MVSDYVSCTICQPYYFEEKRRRVIILRVQIQFVMPHIAAETASIPVCKCEIRCTIGRKSANYNMKQNFQLKIGGVWTIIAKEKWKSGVLSIAFDTPPGFHEHRIYPLCAHYYRLCNFMRERNLKTSVCSQSRYKYSHRARFNNVVSNMEPGLCSFYPHGISRAG